MTDTRGIYRAPGGSGDAVADTSNESVTAINAAAEAEASKIAAALSATNAANSATSASASASTATTKASEASTSASNASTSAATATTKASQASSSASSAATSATNSATSATESNDSAVVSTTQAGVATTKASEASTSAANALTSANNAASSATTASTKAAEASTSSTSAAASASTATTKASEASSSASSAASSASTATTQASNASTSASTATTQAGIASNKSIEAAVSASNAASSASAASTSATNSANSATAASTAQTAAETAKSATEAIYDNFDDRYLGAKTTDPTLDNDGNALVIGALFFSTTDNIMKVYTATGWLSAYASLSGALIATNNLSDLTNLSLARGNLGLGSIATQSASSVNITGGTIDGVALTNIVDLDVANNVQIDGNLTVSGTTVTLNTTNLAVEDNMIYLNDGSAVTNPDLGIAGNYNDGTYRHSGVFRDASDGRWKFFHQYTPEPDASAYIDTSHSSFALADVQVNTLYGNVTGNLTGNADTVTNGVYTTGSYSNPAWITSINYSKLTGTIPTWNQNTTGNAATATAAAGSGFFTQATGSEGSIGCRFSGQNDVYLFNNAAGYGIYSASGGAAFNYTRSSNSFNFNGNANTATTATNSTQVGGIAANRIVYGDGAFKSSASSSFNDLTKPTGYYYGDSATGAPTVAWYNWMNMMGDSWQANNNYGCQFAQHFWDDNFYVRRVANGTWQTWRELLHSGNYGNYRTFTGDITVGAGGSSTITMVDTDEGNRLIHCNSNRIGFLNQANGWGSYCNDDGSWQSDFNITAFSDERKKKNWRPVTEDYVEKLANVKVGVYDRIDADLTQVGVSAQSLQKVLPEAVIEDKDGYLTVAYGNAALTSAVELAKELVALKELVKELKAEVVELKKGN